MGGSAMRMAAPEQARVTVNQRILVHLLAYLWAAERFDAPREVTQQGMAEVLGVRRSHVTLALKTLAQRGLVEDRSARIVGGTRRKKAYALTPLGYARARETQAWMDALARFPAASAQVVQPLATPMGPMG